MLNFKKKVIKDIKNKLQEIYYINYQNNSINGVANYLGEKIFFKILNHNDFIKEMNGYLVSFKKIPIMNIVFIKHLYHSKKYMIAYNYENSINKNSGLLNDYFVFKDNAHKLSSKDIDILNNILKIYDESFKHKEFKNYCPINIFFHERVNSRLIKWYKKNKDFKKSVNISDKSTNEIIFETIDYFKKNKKTNFESYLTQGDPNTLNIALKPCFFDLVTAGYNPIIAEFSVAFISTLLYDNYFAPKYHAKSYFNHEKILDKYNAFSPDIAWDNNKNIAIKSNIITSQIRKEYIKCYINILKKNNINISKDIIYYFVMRLLCVFDINKFENKDYYYSIYLIHYLYKNIKEDTYKSILSILDDMEVI